MYIPKNFVETNSYIVIKTIRTFNTNELFTSCLIGILNRIVVVAVDFLFLLENELWFSEKNVMDKGVSEAFVYRSIESLEDEHYTDLLRYHFSIIFCSEFRNDLIHLNQTFNEYIAWMSHNDYIYSLAL